MEGRPLLPLAARTVLVCALLVGVATAAAIVWNRSYQVDEVEHIHAAYDMRDGRVLYRDFWQGHPPLLHVLLYPVIDVDDPVASFHRSRLVSGLLLIAVIALAARCAQRLAGTSALLAAVGLMLFETTLIERGMEVRPDGGLALCIVAALALELGELRPSVRLPLEGLLLGTGFLFTQKAIFASAAFGALWLFHGVRERRWRLVALPALAWLVPLAVALLLMTRFGCAREFVQQNLVDAFRAGAGAGDRTPFSPLPWLRHEGTRNVAFFVLATAGAIWLATRRRGDAGFVAFLALALFAAVWANPFPWPYVHVAFLPVLAVCAACLVAAVDHETRLAVAAAIALAMLTATPRLLQKVPPGTALQFATLREIQRVIGPRDRVFDLVGLYFRPDAYPSGYSLSGELLRRYARGGFPPMVPELRRNRCAAVLLNYRTGGLGPDEQRFFAEHFVHYWSTIYLPGRELGALPAGATTTLEVLQPRAFRYLGEGVIRVDGAPFTEGTLNAGTHSIAVERAASTARLIVATPPPIPLPAPPVALYVNFD